MAHDRTQLFFLNDGGNNSGPPLGDGTFDQSEHPPDSHVAIHYAEFARIFLLV